MEKNEKRQLPKGWTWAKLGGKNGIAEIINGSTPSTDEPAFWNGDILWATPTDFGKLDSIYIEDTESFVPKEGIHGPYLYFAIKMIVPEIQKQSHGNTFVEITKDLIKHFEIPLPPTLDDQIAIANEIEKKMAEEICGRRL